LRDHRSLELTAGPEAKGYWRLSPERRAAVIEARRENGVSRATVSRIERGDSRGGAVPADSSSAPEKGPKTVVRDTPRPCAIGSARIAGR
jgi:hypothetical protein